MSKALDRSQRAGSDPIQIGNTKLVTDGNNDLTIQDTSNNRKKILASEVHLGDSSNVVILKKGSDNKIEFQTQASGGSATSSNAGGTVVYATISAMTAVSASAGDQALVTANSGLYVHNGGGWYKVATINTSPTISSPSTGGSFTLALDGTATTIELVGADVDEGTTLQNSYAVTTGSLTNGGGATATVSTSSTSNGTYTALNPSTNTTNRFFKVTPTTNTSYAGSFTLTFSVSDGINAATTVQSFSLEFTSYGSAYFDGTDDYLSVASSSDFALGTGDFTIECWVKFTETSYEAGSNRRIFALDDGGNAADNIQIIIDEGSYSVNGDLLLYSNSVLGYLNTDIRHEWHHIAIVRNSGTLKFYLDGVQKASASNTQNYSPNSGSPTPLIGQRGDNKGDYNGYISNLRIVVGTAVYTSNFTVPTSPLTAITNTKLLTAHKNDEIVDGSSSNHTITKFGNATEHASNPFSNNTIGYGSLYFDGSGDYLSIPNSANFYNLGTADWTIEFWVYVIDLPDHRGVFQLGKDTGALCAMIYTNGKIKLIENDQAVVFESNSSLSTNTWYHIAFTNNDYNNTQKLYINGVAQSNTGSKSTAFSYSDKTIIIGGRWYSNSFQKAFKGYISNFRIVGGSEVYTSNFTPSTTPLTAITNTKLLTAQRSTPLAITNGSYHITSTSNTNITTSTSSDFTFGTSTDFTIEFWYKFYSSVNINGYLFDVGNNTLLVYAPSSSRLDSYSVGGTIISANSNAGTSVGVWHHLAIQRSGNVHTFYINGQSVGTTTDSGNVHNINNNYLRIGNYGGGGQGGGYGQNAYFSDFRVVKGTAVYSGNFTPPSGPLTKTGGTYPSNTNVNTSIPSGHTVLLTAQNSSGTYIDNSDSNHTLTAAGTVNIGDGADRAVLDQSTSNYTITANGNTRNAIHWPFNYNG